MVHYKIIKTCRLCKTRFTVGKEGARRNYCEKCEQAYKASQAVQTAPSSESSEDKDKDTE
jgi:hypothetical protein